MTNKSDEIMEIQAKVEKIFQSNEFLYSVRDNIFTNYEVLNTAFLSIWRNRKDEKIEFLSFPLPVIVELFGNYFTLVGFKFSDDTGVLSGYFIDEDGEEERFDNLPSITLIQALGVSLSLLDEERVNLMLEIIMEDVKARFQEMSDEEEGCGCSGDSCGCDGDKKDGHSCDCDH